MGKGFKLSPKILVGLVVLLLIGLLVSFIPRFIGMIDNIGSSSSNVEGVKKNKAIELEFGSYHYGDYDFLFEDYDEMDEVWFKYKPKSDRPARIYVENLDQNYSIVLYEGNNEVCRAINGEQLNCYLEKGTKYFIVVEVSKASRYEDDYYGIDRTFDIKIGNPIPEGADADHAYPVEIGKNEPMSYESLLPEKTYPEDKKGLFGSVSTSSGDYGYSDVVWFRFTPEESSKYTFTLFDFESSSYIRLYNGYDMSYDIASTYDNYLEYALEGGRTYYYKVQVERNYNYGDGTLDTNFGIDVETEPKGSSYMSAYELELGTNYSDKWESLNSSSEVWFKFKPENSGYYSIGTGMIEGTPDMVVYEMDIYPGSEPLKNIVYPEDSYYYFDNDQYYYILVDVYHGERSFDIAILQPEGTDDYNAIEMNLGESMNATHISSVYHGTVYFKFEPTEDGIYSFSIPYISSGSYSVYLYENYITGSSIDYVENGSIVCELSSEYVYYFVFCPYNTYSDIEFSAKVSLAAEGSAKKVAIDLGFGETDYQEWDALEDQNFVWFSFSPEKESYHFFDVTGLSYDSYIVDVYYTYDSTVSYIASDDHRYFLLDNEVMYYVRITVSDYEVGFGINVDTLKGVDYNNSIELVESESVNVYYNTSLFGNYQVWYAFTPEEDGMYEFSVSSAYAYNLYLYNEYDMYNYIVYKDNSGLYYEFKAGNTYYFKLSPYYNSTTNYEVCISPAAAGTTKESAIDLTENGLEYQLWDSMISQDYVYFKFTPEYSGHYKFYSNTSSTYVYLYSDVDNNSAMSGIYSSPTYSYALKAGKTYYIMLENYYYDELDVVVESYNQNGYAKVTSYVLDYNTTLYTGYSSSYNSNGEMWFAFTPDSGQYYTFYLGNCYSCYVYLYEGDNSSYTSYYSSTSFSRTLYAGTTYYFKIVFTGSYDSNFYVQIY